MPWIRVVEKEDPDCDPRLKGMYEAAEKRAGKVSNILKIQSLSPETLRASTGLYITTMLMGSGLTRAQREMMAVVVSKTNDCGY